MSRRRIRIEEVLVYLGVEASFLERLREEGLFQSDEIEPEEAEDLRLATVLMEELGVNPAGVEVVLHLRRRLFALEGRARVLAEALESTQRRR
jgi:hypothetical protein